MKKNQNHPRKGSRIKVEPIRDVKDIRLIGKLLEDRPLYAALFTVGINTNLRASDLISLKIGQVRGLAPMGEIEIWERKTGKLRRVTINKHALDAISALLRAFPGQDDDDLFRGQRGTLTVGSVHRLVKSWCRSIHLRGNYGSHTLRKTWGYHQRVTYGVGLPELMTCFNHATQRETLNYLCVQPQEIRSVYANVIG